MSEDTNKDVGSRNNPAAVPLAPGFSLDNPTRWSLEDCHNSLRISKDRLSLCFQDTISPGLIHGKNAAAAARADSAVPCGARRYYYEVTILDAGRRGHISIGLACSDVRLDRLPGWELNSWGYHGDDGSAFAGEREGEPFGPKFTTGDVIGCGVELASHRVFYTKNGTFLGYAFEDKSSSEPIFPSVGLRTAGETVRANFGQEPFIYDVEHLAFEGQVAQRQERDN